MLPTRVKSRQSANPTEQVTLTVNEKILKECHSLYTDQEKGLIKIAEPFGLKLLAPRKKIIVLLIGNHSAGKSSFINWYIEEHVQRTGLAIETQGFVIITSGKKRESLTGNATLHLYPHFRPLQDIHGVVDFLSTEISTSKQKRFSLVSFVDTPGLVDGDMQYPFNVNEAVLWLGEMADLIFTFFDPIGQALCKRTLNLVEKLNAAHAEKMRFYLSKADQAGDESDRQRVMMQIVQELCKRPGLNRTGFDMPTIFIPEMNKNARCVNQIDGVCKDIERTINQTIQNTLNSLERDCNAVSKLLQEKLDNDEADCSYNIRAFGRAVVLGALGIIFPLLFAMNLMVSAFGYNFLSSVIGVGATDLLNSSCSLWGTLTHHQQFIVIGISIILLFIVKSSLGLKATLSRKQKLYFTELQDHVETYIKARKHHLYREYLEQSVGDCDL